MITLKNQYESVQLEKLRAMLAFIKNESANEFYRTRLDGIDPATLTKIDDLARLPFTLKAELVAAQQSHPPFGNFYSYPLAKYTKYHQTSGTTGRPLKVLDTPESWDWWARCWVQVYESAGVAPDDRVFIAFSFGPFIGFWTAYEGANQLGALTIPGGGMDTDQRLDAIFEQQATVLCCTPSYALYMAEVAAKNGIDLAKSSIKATIHAGEPGASIPAVRQRIEQAWGAKCYDHAGMTELGAYGFSCREQTGLHINEEEFIVEVLDLDTGQPVEPGQTGELVITNLGRWSFPVIRYRTGDMVKFATELCPCGSSFRLLEGGIIGRVDNMIIVRGINIFPSSVDAIVREVVPTNEYRMIFTREYDMDALEVEVEIEENDNETVGKLGHLFRHRLALRVPVKPVPVGSLPRFQLKARRIVDRRPRLT